MEAANNNEGDMFFLYGYGGTGKTYIWRTLASSLRAKNQIVIMVASSGIASLLLPGGRTAHSKFKIPVPIFQDSTCNILQGSQLAELLNQTNLIIWDEAPMAHKFCFQALDQSLTDIIKEKKFESNFWRQSYCIWWRFPTNSVSHSKRKSFRHYKCNNQFIISLAFL